MKKYSVLWLGAACLGLGAALWLVQLAGAQTNGLAIVQTSSNQFQLTITNAVAGETYVIYRTPALANPYYPWRYDKIGAPSQTVFTVELGTDVGASFFRSVSGTNWDGDMSPNWEDGNAVDPNIGRLSVTIDSPGNGSIVQ